MISVKYIYPIDALQIPYTYRPSYTDSDSDLDSNIDININTNSKGRDYFESHTDEK